MPQLREYLNSRYNCSEAHLVSLCNDPPYISSTLMHRIITLAHEEVVHQSLHEYLAQELNQAITLSRDCFKHKED